MGKFSAEYAAILAGEEGLNMEKPELVIVPDLPAEHIHYDGVTYVNRDYFLKVIYEETSNSGEHAEWRPA